MDYTIPNAVTFSWWLSRLQEESEFDAEQMQWVKHTILKYVPFHVIALWQGFPEWVVTDREVAKQNIQISLTYKNNFVVATKNITSIKVLIQGHLAGEIKYEN